MSMPTSTSHSRLPDSPDLKADIEREGTPASGQARVPADPSIPTPGAAEKGERICDAPSDPHKPAGVESVDKGA